MDRWGLLGEVLATGAPLLTRLSLNFPGARLTGLALALGAITGGCAPRRYALDHLLVQAAVRVRMYTGQGMGAGCIPTPDGLTLVSVQVSRTTPAHDDRHVVFSLR